MFWMATGVLMVAVTPLFPMLPALGWDPTELAGEGIGERGDGTPVLLRGWRQDLVTHINQQIMEHIVSGTAA